MMIYSMLFNRLLQSDFNAYMATGSILVSCFTIQAQVQKFSQDFIAIVQAKKSSIKSKKPRLNLYAIGSHVITATALMYATYHLYLLRKNSNNATFMKKYILPVWLSDCTDTGSIILGVSRLVLKTLAYKGVAQILLALSTCPLKDNVDYLFTNKYAAD